MKQSQSEKFYELASTLCQILISILSSEAAKNFARRLTLLSRSVYVPTDGAGDHNLIAAYLNKSDRTIEDTVRDRGLTKFKTGTEHVYRFDELLLNSTVANEDRSTSIVPKRTTFRKPRGKARTQQTIKKKQTFTD